MDYNAIAFWMAVVDVLCWPICFWWMYHISAKHNRILDELREQGRRIEQLSKEEHQLIREVHPQVGDIKAGVEEVAATVKDLTDSAEHAK
jgi:methyl-accepting chemotaxis protein